MEPTRIGGAMLPAVTRVPEASAPGVVALPVGLTMPENFPLTLDAQELNLLQTKLKAFDFASIRQDQIAMLESAPTDELNRVLGGLLSRINKAENPEIFHLVGALDEAIEKEKLGELADKILNAKPSIMDRVAGLFSKKALRKAMDRAYEELERTAKLKSRNLEDVVNGFEQRIRVGMSDLIAELQQIDTQKSEYRKAFNAFASGTAFLYNALSIAKAQAPALLASAGNDLMLQHEIQDKLIALESVTLSREAMMTRMPSEQIVVQQLQSAGVAVIQEMNTTLGDRMASIRMTLLGIHNAQKVQSVQRLSESGSRLDNNLLEVRARLTGAVVAAAVNAPGDNRIEQANNLRRVVADSKSMLDVVETGRVATVAKFSEARSTLSGVRQELLVLGQKINPAASVVLQSH